MTRSISFEASASRPRSPTSEIAAYGPMRLPVASLTASTSATSRAASSKSPPHAAAWPHDVVRHGEDLERPSVACELDRARRDLEAAVVVPQPDRRPRRQPTPPEHLLRGGLAARERGDRAPQHRRRRARALGEDQREAVEQQVARKRTIRRSGGARRGTGDVEQAAAGAGEVAGEQRRAPRVEVRVAREAYVERLELPRGLGAAGAGRRCRDSARTRSRPGAGRCAPGRARPGVRPPRWPEACGRHRTRPRRGWPGPLRAPGRPGARGRRQRDRTLQEGGCGRLAAARLRPAG